MFAVHQPDSIKGLWRLPNILAQKIPSDNEFNATVKFNFFPKTEGERFGLVILGLDYVALSVVRKTDGNYLVYTQCKDADKNGLPVDSELMKISVTDLHFQVNIKPGGQCSFTFFMAGGDKEIIPRKFLIKPGKWVGAKLGMYYSRSVVTNDGGYVDIDWFRIE